MSALRHKVCSRFYNAGIHSRGIDSMHGLTRDDSTLIGFVVSCYFSAAISTAELNAWAEHMMASHDDYPAYLLDLLYFDASPMHVFRTIGFVPDVVPTAREGLAISGLGYLRGHAPSADGPPPSLAMQALQQLPEIAARFRAVFPFIALPAAAG